MPVILVAARCNIDRIWHLAGPLRRGGRTAFSDKVLRYGGGGTSTGRGLLQLGNDVRLLGSLADDEAGRRYRSDLQADGFDTRGLRLVPGRTRPVEILVEPDGERTILSDVAVEHARLCDIPLEGVDALYVNVRHADGPSLQQAADRVTVVAQLPLEEGEPRPAHVLIASRSDWPEGLGDDPFRTTVRVGGPSLRALVRTCGADPTEIWTSDGCARIPVEPLANAPIDTTGAGDAFAAGLVDAIARHRPLGEAVRAGSAAARRFLEGRARGTLAEAGPDPRAAATLSA